MSKKQKNLLTCLNYSLCLPIESVNQNFAKVNLVLISLITQNFAKGERGVLVTFLIFQFLVLLILYAHCTVGESLLTEVRLYRE